MKGAGPILTCMCLVVATGLAANAVWRLATDDPALGAVPTNGEWRPDLAVAEPAAKEAERPSSYPETLSRPVFAPSRRPPPPKVEEPEPVEVVETAPEPPPEPEPPPITAEQFRLAGVLVLGGDRRALLRSPSSPEGTWIGVGASLDGWKVDDIQPGSATLSSGESSHRLELYGVANAPH